MMVDMANICRYARPCVFYNPPAEYPGTCIYPWLCVFNPQSPINMFEVFFRVHVISKLYVLIFKI